MVFVSSIVQAGLLVRVQHWGDDQHILVNFLIFGGWFQDFLFGGRKTHVFLLHSSKIFLMTFFLLKSKLLGGWRLNTGGNPPNIWPPSNNFDLSKKKEKRYIPGGCIPPSPRNLQPWVQEPMSAKLPRGYQSQGPSFLLSFRSSKNLETHKESHCIYLPPPPYVRFLTPFPTLADDDDP